MPHWSTKELLRSADVLQHKRAPTLTPEAKTRFDYRHIGEEIRISPLGVCQRKFLTRRGSNDTEHGGKRAAVQLAHIGSNQMPLVPLISANVVPDDGAATREEGIRPAADATA